MVVSNADHRHCEDCVYFGQTGIYETCDYLLHTGHKRPCPAGKGCTVKTTNKKMVQASLQTIARRPPAVRSRTWDTALGLKMYGEGKLDTEIAAVVGVSAQSIANWRKDMGLPTNYRRKAAPANRIGCV